MPFAPEQQCRRWKGGLQKSIAHVEIHKVQIQDSTQLFGYQGKCGKLMTLSKSIMKGPIDSIFQRIAAPHKEKPMPMVLTDDIDATTGSLVVGFPS